MCHKINARQTEIGFDISQLIYLSSLIVNINLTYLFNIKYIDIYQYHGAGDSKERLETSHQGFEAD